MMKSTQIAVGMWVLMIFFCHIMWHVTWPLEPGIVKGCIMRALDNASCEHMFLYPFGSVFLEIDSLKYRKGILRRALYDIGTRYVVVRQFVSVVASWAI